MNIEEKLQKLPSLRLTVEAAGLMAKKALGQNFLLDSNITEKIIRLSLDKQSLQDYKNSCVFEVGPGPGGLTRAVLKSEPKVLTVIEMDERCINLMQQLREVCGNHLQIVNADALTYDFKSPEALPCHIVSNLPYNISVPLLVGWLERIKDFQSLTLMFQKEVAERIMAQPRSKEYGRLSVLAQLQCRIDKLFDLNPQCFVPAPKIWSSVLLFRPLEKTLTAEELKKLASLTSMAFNQRRKMIRHSLKSLPNLEEICTKLEIPLTSRAEEITPEQYLSFAQLL